MIYRHGQPIPRVKVSLRLLKVLRRKLAKTTENNSFHARGLQLLTHAIPFTPDLKLYVNLIAIAIFMERYFYSWSAGDEKSEIFCLLNIQIRWEAPEELDTKIVVSRFLLPPPLSTIPPPPCVPPPATPCSEGRFWRGEGPGRRLGARRSTTSPLYLLLWLHPAVTAQSSALLLPRLSLCT